MPGPVLEEGKGEVSKMAGPSRHQAYKNQKSCKKKLFRVQYQVVMNISSPFQELYFGEGGQVRELSDKSYKLLITLNNN